MSRLPERDLLLSVAPGREKTEVLVKGYAASGQLMWSAALSRIPATTDGEGGVDVGGVWGTSKGPLMLSLRGSLVVLDPLTGKTLFRDTYCARPNVALVLSDPEA